MLCLNELGYLCVIYPSHLVPLLIPAARYAGPQTADAKRLLAAAKTGQLHVWGANVLGLPACRLNRFTSPEQAALLLGTPAGQGGAGGPDAVLVQALAARSLLAGALQPRASIRDVAAGADFAVLMTWDGGIIDSRLLGAAAQQGARRQRALALPQLWRPPGSAAVAVAAGGCWLGGAGFEHPRPCICACVWSLLQPEHHSSQSLSAASGSGKEGGGHVLVLAADGSLWGWGGNTQGQLGLGLETEWVAAAAEALDPAAAEALGRVRIVRRLCVATAAAAALLIIAHAEACQPHEWC